MANLLVNVGDVSLDLIESFGVLVVAFVLAHEFDVAFVDGSHLGLVVASLSVL